MRRKQRTGEITESAAAMALAHVEEQMQRATIVEAGSAVRSRALRLLGGHALGSGDALQLAAALAWSADKPRGHAFVTLDVRLAKSALAEGFDVLPALR